MWAGDLNFRGVFLSGGETFGTSALLWIRLCPIWPTSWFMIVKPLQKNIKYLSHRNTQHGCGMTPGGGGVVRISKDVVPRELPHLFFHREISEELASSNN